MFTNDFLSEARSKLLHPQIYSCLSEPLYNEYMLLLYNPQIIVDIYKTFQENQGKTIMPNATPPQNNSRNTSSGSSSLTSFAVPSSSPPPSPNASVPSHHTEAMRKAAEMSHKVIEISSDWAFEDPPMSYTPDLRTLQDNRRSCHNLLVRLAPLRTSATQLAASASDRCTQFICRITRLLREKCKCDMCERKQIEYEEFDRVLQKCIETQTFIQTRLDELDGLIKIELRKMWSGSRLP